VVDVEAWVVREPCVDAVYEVLEGVPLALCSDLDF